MKPKKAPRTLTLSKTTVANLGNMDLHKVKGGYPTTILDTIGLDCPPNTFDQCTFTRIQQPSYCIICIIPG